MNYSDLNPFARSYVACALWSTHDIRESTLAPSVCAVLRAKVRELRREYLAGIQQARQYVANPYLLER